MTTPFSNDQKANNEELFHDRITLKMYAAQQIRDEYLKHIDQTHE